MAAPPSQELEPPANPGRFRVTPTDISTQRDIYTSERCISVSGLKTLRALPANSVLVTCIASIGKNAVLKAAGACNQQINAVIPNKNHAAEFLYYVFENNKHYLLSNSGITATSIISKTAFKTLSFALPPTKFEQEAIADALGNADDLINSLEQVVVKKRHVKQGAMQELLTGKKRLPGFEMEPSYKQTEVGLIPSDWAVKFLPDVCNFRSGKAHEQYISELGQFVCVNSKFVSTDGNVRKYCTANFCCAKRGDILMVMSDLPNGRALAKTFLADQDDLYAVNQRVCALTPYHDCPRYLY
jgi:restriction endonuclease S subunit